MPLTLIALPAGTYPTSSVTPILFDDVDIVDGLHCTFYPPGAAVNVLQTGVGLADVIPCKVRQSGANTIIEHKVLNQFKQIKAYNVGIAKVTAQSNSFTTNLNSDVVSNCAKDAVNFMADYFTSQQFRNLALNAGRSAVAVATIGATVPAAMPIALAAFAANIAINLCTPAVTVPPSAGSLTYQSERKWIFVNDPIPNDPTPAITPSGSGGSGNYQDEKATANYIANNAVIRDQIAQYVRSASLKYVKDRFQELGENWNIEGGMDQGQLDDLDSQIEYYIQKSAQDRARRYDYGFDKQLNKQLQSLDNLSSLSKLSKLDLLSNLAELVCICDGIGSVVSALTSDDGCCISKEDLDSYLVPTGSINPAEWNFADSIKQVALRPADESGVVYVDGF